MPARNQCLVVLGMHRSGTSALTGVLNLLGIHPGNRLLPAMEDVNPKGFWEHTEIVSIHDQLLEAFDSSWYDEDPLPGQWPDSPITAAFHDKIIEVLHRDFGEQPVWLVKDPRLCRLLPWWQKIFRELTCQPLYILVLRNPAEVAGSLRKRDDLTEAASCLLWLAHMLEAEYQTRGQVRVFVKYERLLSDWQETVTAIGQAIGLDWPVAITDAAPDIDAFLDPSLRHHAASATLPDHPACQLAREVFELLSAPSPDPGKLDSLRARTEELISLVVPWSKRLRRCERFTRQGRATLARLESENTMLHSEIRRVKSSISWRITKPVRLLQYLIRSIIPHSTKS